MEDVGEDLMKIQIAMNQKKNATIAHNHSPRSKSPPLVAETSRGMEPWILDFPRNSPELMRIPATRYVASVAPSRSRLRHLVALTAKQATIRRPPRYSHAMNTAARPSAP